MGTINRRQFLSRVAVALGATPVLLATACGTAAPAPTATKAPAPAATTAPAPAATTAPATQAPAATVAAATQAPAAVKLDWPKQPINLLVSSTAGGSSDIGCRILAAGLEPILKQPVVVVNQPGGGQIPMQTNLFQAKPDGYTIGHMNTPAIQYNILNKDQVSVPYAWEDFVAVASYVSDPGTFAVNVDSPLKTLGDIIKTAKDKNGAMTAGTTGIGGDEDFLIAMLEDKAGVRFRRVHVGGSAALRPLVMGNKVEVYVGNVGDTAVDDKQGNMRAICVFWPQRSEMMPKTPTAKEEGFDITGASNRGFFYPKGISMDIVKIMDEAIAKVLADPVYKKKYDDAGLPVNNMRTADWKKFMDDQFTVYKNLMPLLRSAQTQKVD